MRPSRSRSQSAIPTSRSARMCSRRWRATTRACAGARSRSTRGRAKDALDRITIPQDVLDRIAPTALPRSSIIISDEPLSGETNYRTEFVAVLNNQPQGGFMTRKPTADVAVGSDNYWGDDGFGSLFQPNWNSQTAIRVGAAASITVTTRLVVRCSTPCASSVVSDYFLPRLAPVANGGFFLSNAFRERPRQASPVQMPTGRHAPAPNYGLISGCHAGAYRRHARSA